MINHKEKAIELVDKFKAQLLTATPDLNRPTYQAKQCAIIAVDVILNCNHGWNKKTSEFVKDWQQVKNEINKL